MEQLTETAGTSRHQREGVSTAGEKSTYYFFSLLYFADNVCTQLWGGKKPLMLSNRAPYFTDTSSTFVAKLQDICGMTHSLLQNT